MSAHVKIVPFHSLGVSTGGVVKIVPFSFTWCQHRLRGGAGRKTVLLIFQPTHFIVHYILLNVFYYDLYEKYGEKNRIIFSPVLRFHGNGGHLCF